MKYQINELIEMFLGDQVLNGRSSSVYKNALELFFRWVFANRLDFTKLAKHNIIKYKQEIEAKYSLYTANNYFGIIRSFYRWTEHNGIMNDITFGIRKVKINHGINKYPLTSEQVVKLLKSISIETYTGLRNYLIIDTMIRYGLRCIEVSRINVGDIKEENGIHRLYIQRKGHLKKDCSINLTSATTDIIAEYLATRRHVSNEQPLFESQQDCHLTSSSISKIVKRYLKAIGLDNEKYCAHSLRHTCATLLMDKGKSLEEVQGVLGHHSPATTQIYNKLRAEMQAINNTIVRALDDVMNIPLNYVKKGGKTDKNKLHSHQSLKLMADV